MYAQEPVFILPSGMWVRFGKASTSGGYCLKTNDTEYYNLIDEEMGDDRYLQDRAQALQAAVSWVAKHPEVTVFSNKTEAINAGY